MNSSRWALPLVRWWNDHRTLALATLAVPVLIIAVIVGRASVDPARPVVAATAAADTETPAPSANEVTPTPQTTSEAASAVTPVPTAEPSTQTSPDVVEPVAPTPPAAVEPTPVSRQISVKQDLIQFLSYDLTAQEQPPQCQGGTGGFSDIGVGSSVTVEDGSSNVIATGTLTDGHFVDFKHSQQAVPPNNDYSAPMSSWPQHTFVYGYCTYSGVVDAPDSSFYKVEVSHRGDVTMSRQELEADNWVFSLSLSSSS